MRKPEGETEYAPHGGGTGEETRGVMGERRTPVPGPSLGAKRPWPFPGSLDNALFARMKSLRFEIANCAWDT